MKLHTKLIMITTACLSLACHTITPSTRRKQDLMIPMDDGVQLATTLYLPKGTGPWATVLVRTPYGRDGYADFGKKLAQKDIAVAIQDSRGRFDSQGEDAVFGHDQQDGHAMLSWITAQAWSNGKVMTYGGSAMGITQYMMAPNAPEALRGQWIVVATPDLYHHTAYEGGVYRQALVDGWLIGNGSEHMVAPFRSNPRNTPYWDVRQPYEQVANVHIPAVHVGGWYDIFARGTIAGFLNYQNHGGVGAKGQQHLIMGPWPHSINQAEVGELTFPNAVLDQYGDYEHIFLKATLLNDAESQAEIATWPPVYYFTMGATDVADAPGNEWHTAETWPPAGTTETALYLHTSGKLHQEAPNSLDAGTSFTYDPQNPSPTLGGANLNLPAGAYDQRAIEARDDVLVYSTAPLDAPLEVTGDLFANIWLTTDVPDTDIAIRLTDVYPDGRSMLILDSIARARFHNSPNFTSEAFLEPGVPVSMTIDLGPTSIIFNTGHQLRISITGANAPRFSPNPNTGANYVDIHTVGENEPGQIANTTILHDAEHPSCLILPVRR